MSLVETSDFLWKDLYCTTSLSPSVNIHMIRFTSHGIDNRQIKCTHLSLPLRLFSLSSQTKLNMPVHLYICPDIDKH